MLRTRKFSHALAALLVLAGIVSCNSTTKADEEFERRKREDDALRKTIEQQRKHHDMSAGNEENTWKHYIP